MKVAIITTYQKQVNNELIPMQYRVICEPSNVNEAKEAITDLAKSDGLTGNPVQSITIPVHG